MHDGKTETIILPYGRGRVSCSLEADCIKGVLKPAETHAPGDEEEIIRNAMKNPIGSPPLEILAKSASSVLIIASDHTRPVPSKLIIPPMLSAIQRGNPDAQVKILIATGFHRPTTEAELLQKFGKEIIENCIIEMHAARNPEDMVYKGLLPSGGELWLNKRVDWADLIISEGFIEPHFFAGFSGGRKSILPGIASQTTVFANHCTGFIAHQRSRTGVLNGNPIHRDMVFAAKKAGLRYIVNVAIDSGKKVIAAFAGDPFAAHEKGAAFVAENCGVPSIEADIVITSNGGYPLDQNIYQAVKGMTAAEACVKKGGVIIMCAACSDGHGSEDFYRWFTQAHSAGEVLARIEQIPQKDTLPDQWEAQILARVLCHAQVVMVCEPSARQLVQDMHMRFAPTLQEAVELARTLAGGTATVVIPDGVGVIVGR